MLSYHESGVAGNAARPPMVRVERARVLCPACGQPDWCLIREDGAIGHCMRSPDGPAGQGKPLRNKSGEDYWLHVYAEVREGWTPPESACSRPAARAATPEVLDRAYTAALDGLRLSDQHRADLLGRGLSESTIRREGYRTLFVPGRAALARRVAHAIGAERALEVPGVYLASDGTQSWLSFAGNPGLVIPCRDEAGRIFALRIRRDDAVKNKYLYVSSASDRQGRGPSPPRGIHFPIFDGPRSEVRLTEGELKAAVLTELTGTLTLSVPGVTMWREFLPTLRDLKPQHVIVAWDRDWKTKATVRRTCIELIRALQEEGYHVSVEQ